MGMLPGPGSGTKPGPTKSGAALEPEPISTTSSDEPLVEEELRPLSPGAVPEEGAILQYRILEMQSGEPQVGAGWGHKMPLDQAGDLGLRP